MRRKRRKGLAAWSRGDTAIDDGAALTRFADAVGVNAPGARPTR